MEAGNDKPKEPLTTPIEQPATPNEPAAASAEPAATRPASSGGGGGAGRTIGQIATGLVGGLGLLLALAGIAVIAVYAFGRDDDGYFNTGDEPFQSRGYAVTTDELDLGGEGTIPDDIGVDFRIDAEAPAGQSVFLGLADSDDAAGYLAKVERSTVSDFDDNGGVTYDEHIGRAPAGPPASEGFWVEQAEGSGDVRLEHGLEGGNYTLVLMNADGSRPVAAEVSAGVKIGWLIWVGVGLLVAGAAIAGVCGWGLNQLSKSR